MVIKCLQKKSPATTLCSRSLSNLLILQTKGYFSVFAQSYEPDRYLLMPIQTTVITIYETVAFHKELHILTASSPLLAQYNFTYLLKRCFSEVFSGMFIQDHSWEFVECNGKTKVRTCCETDKFAFLPVLNIIKVFNVSSTLIINALQK